MSTAEALTKDLPGLRRYARALTGSQASGDAYITTTLEALVEDASALEQASSHRTGLYGAFTKIWNSLGVNATPEPGAPDGVGRHIAGITPAPRQAFLLTALEGFSEQETAEVLGISIQAVRELVEQCGRELAEEIATDVLIIEDEPMISMELESLVLSLGHSVTGIARTRSEALLLAGSKRPGLILADIRLADESSGLDAVNDLLKSFEVPVIFITAYPERYLTGQRPEPTFLITKPFQPAMVSAVISQALFFEQRAKRTPRPAMQSR
jgi:DNA-directed RNA polymerase specialized sigma24 family protein